MKSTTGKQTTRPTTGSIPKEHEELNLEQAAKFSLWLEGELGDLESRFATFTTRHTLLADLSNGR